MFSRDVGECAACNDDKPPVVVSITNTPPLLPHLGEGTGEGDGSGEGLGSGTGL
jgi:hypothetical protein